jgi:hypothetical protein
MPDVRDQDTASPTSKIVLYTLDEIPTDVPAFRPLRDDQFAPAAKTQAPPPSTGGWLVDPRVWLLESRPAPSSHPEWMTSVTTTTSQISRMDTSVEADLRESSSLSRRGPAERRGGTVDQFDFGPSEPLLISASGSLPTPRRARPASSGSTARAPVIFSLACLPHHGRRGRIRGRRAARRGR